MWGSNTKEIDNFITITAETGIGNVSPTEMTIDANAGQVNIRFAEAGNYEVEVFNLNGQCLQRNLVKAAAGQVVKAETNASTGTYILRISKDGKTIKSIKLTK